MDHFWPSFGGNFGVTFGAKTESKSGPFFGKAPGGHLEALWEVSWLSWGSLGRPGVPKILQKTIQNSNFQNHFFSLSEVLGMAFGGHVGSFWGGFGAQNGPQKPLKTSPKTGPKFYNVLDNCWVHFGVHFGAKNCSKRDPKLGPLLEPRPTASQGARARVFTNYTRGVERLLELELYSPKEREGRFDCYSFQFLL